MNAEKGIYGIRLVAKGLMILGSVLVMLAVLLRFAMTGRGALLPTLLFSIFPLVAGGSLWIFPWIVEGFTLPSPQNHDAAK